MRSVVPPRQCGKHAVVIDRMIRGELAERKKTQTEIDAVKKYLGWS